MLQLIGENLTKGISSLTRKGFFHLLVAMFAGQGLAFLLKILLGRWLTNEDFSRYSILIETNSVLATFMTLALPTAMMRFGLKENRLNYYFSGIIGLFGFLVLIVVAIFYSVTIRWNLYSDGSINYWLNYTILLAPSFAFFNYIIAYLSADKRAKERGFLILSQRFFYFVCLLGGCRLALWKGTLFGYFLFALAFWGFLFFWYYRQIFVKITNFPYGQVIRFSFWDSLQRIIVISSLYLILPFSQRTLGDLVSISYYTMAISFLVIAKLTYAAVNNIVYPYLMEKKTKEEFIGTLIKILFLISFLSIGIIVVSYTVVPYLIHLLLGDRYLGAIPLFKTMIIGEILVGFAILFEIILEIFNKVKFKAISNLFTMIIFFVALNPLLSNFGIMGAAYAFILFSSIRTICCVSGSLLYLRNL